MILALANLCASTDVDPIFERETDSVRQIMRSYWPRWIWLRDLLYTLRNIETTVEASVIPPGICNYEFALLLYQEVWSASVVTELERADDEGFVSEELVASLRVLAEVTCGNTRIRVASPTDSNRSALTSHVPLKVFGFSLRHGIPELWCSCVDIVDRVQVHLSQRD